MEKNVLTPEVAQRYQALSEPTRILVQDSPGEPRRELDMRLMSLSEADWLYENYPGLLLKRETETAQPEERKPKKKVDSV